MITSLLGRIQRFGQSRQGGSAARDERPGLVSDQAMSVARQVRGRDRKPALLLFGVTPRSGTGYVTNLLGLHPDLYKHPNELWEIPFLQNTDRLLSFQRLFFDAYPHNRERMGANDLLALFGASFIGYLHSFVPENQQALATVPSAASLDFAFTVFPFETPLLLLRDGRDVVASTVATWTHVEFSEACRRWDVGARAILDFEARYASSNMVYSVCKYEDAVQEPAMIVRSMCQQLDLDESRYPFDEIADIPLTGSSSVKKNGSVSWDPIPKPKNFRSLGRWRAWSIQERRTFKAIAGQSLIDTGYCEDLSW